MPDDTPTEHQDSPMHAPDSKNAGPESPHPLEIRLKSQEKRLEIDFSDGAHVSISAELLRYESPSAENKGHGPGQETLVAGRRHVGILNIEPVGHYALRIIFDDLHDTGLYPWDLLYQLGQNHDQRLEAYLAQLAAQGLSRDPPV